MSLGLLIYLADVFDNLKGVLIGLSILSFLAGLLWCMSSYDKDCISSKHIIYCISCGILLLLSTLIPSKQTVYMIAGISASKEVIQSEAAKNAYDLINSYMKFELEKLTGEKK